MKAIERLVAIFGPVVQIMNNLGPIVFGIWLAVVGQWSLIGLGFLAAMLFYLVLKYALLLQTLFLVPIPSLTRKGLKLPVYALIFLSQAYAAVLMIIWCVMIFSFGLNLPASPHNAMIPAFGWLYGVAMAPWTYLVSREIAASGETPSSFLLTFFACLGYTAMAVIVLSGGQLVIAYGFFFAMAVVGLISQFVYSLNMLGSLFDAKTFDAY